MNKENPASDSVVTIPDKINEVKTFEFLFLPGCKQIPLERSPSHVKEQKYYRWLIPMGSWCRMPSSVWSTKVDFRNEKVEKMWKEASEREDSIHLFCLVQESKALEFKDAEKSTGMTVLTIFKPLDILSMEIAIAKARLFGSYFAPGPNGINPFPPYSLTRQEDCIVFWIRKDDEYDFKMIFYFTTPSLRQPYGENTKCLYEYSYSGKKKDYILSEASKAMSIIKTCWHFPSC